MQSNTLLPWEGQAKVGKEKHTVGKNRLGVVGGLQRSPADNSINLLCKYLFSYSSSSSNTVS